MMKIKSIDQYRPLHPGQFIKRVYLIPKQMGDNELASKLNLCPEMVSNLINGEIAVTAEIAQRLSKVLGRSAESWLLMQHNYTFCENR